MDGFRTTDRHCGKRHAAARQSIRTGGNMLTKLLIGAIVVIVLSTVAVAVLAYLAPYCEDCE